MLKFEHKNSKEVREFDDLRNTASKVEDTEQHDIAIVSEIRKEYTLTQEIAIIRKALAHMGCDLPEFVEWNEKVEEIKNQVS